MDLYRVGEPTIGEVWRARFSYGRGSGGLGAGVYAFRDRSAAEDNIENTSPDKELIVLENALSNPIQPGTRDATDALVELSRYMDLLYTTDNSGEFTFEEAIDRGDSLRGSLKSTFGREIGFGSGDALSPKAQTVLLDTPELRTRYEYEPEPFLLDFIRATRRAAQADLSTIDGTAVQPINELLYPDFDGVAPRAGAGGNTGRHGCVVFKQKVDDCVGRETESFETVPATALNRCFS